MGRGLDYTESLRKNSMLIGENVEVVGAWGRAVSRFGGDAGTLQSTLLGLNTNIRETAFTGEGSLSPVLRRLGLNLRTTTGEIKSAASLLPEIAAAFERLSPSESAYLGSQLGLDAGTITLLQQGRAAVDQLVQSQQRKSAVTRQDAEASRLFNLQMNETADVFLVARQRLVTSLLPGLTWFFQKLESIGRWMGENETLVTGFFIAIGSAVALYLIPALVQAAIAMVAATWPILLIAGVVAALAAGFAILYDEITAFANGQNSMLGEAVKRWPILGAIITEFMAQLRTLANVAQWLADLLWALFTNPMEALDILGDGVLAFGQLIIDAFGKVWGAVKGIFEPLAGWFGGDVAVTQTTVPQEVSRGIASAQGAIVTANANPLTSQTSNSLSNSVMRRDTTVQVGEVTVVTQATDGRQVAADFSRSVNEQLRMAVANFDDGVRA